MSMDIPIKPNFAQRKKDREKLFSILRDKVPTDLITERQDLIYQYRNKDQINLQKYEAYEKECRSFWKMNQTKRDNNLKKLVELSGFTEDQIRQAFDSML